MKFKAFFFFIILIGHLAQYRWVFRSSLHSTEAATRTGDVGFG